MPTTPGDLGNFIFNENPYPWPLTLPDNLDKLGPPNVLKASLGKDKDQKNPFQVVELDPNDPRYLEGLFWGFGEKRTYRMSKAIRIEYDYVDPNGNKKTYAIVIGYEGGAGV